MLRAFVTGVIMALVSFAAQAVEYKWTGLVAVKESQYVWDIIDAADNDPAKYRLVLEAALKDPDSGVEPATGTFVFHPYVGGKPTGETHAVELRPEHDGTWYFEAPAHMFEPGKAMCVEVPESWPAIAGQRLYPKAGGFRVNCTDFTEGADKDGIFESNHDAATVVVVEPAG